MSGVSTATGDALRVPTSFAPVGFVAPAAVLAAAVCIFLDSVIGDVTNWWLFPLAFGIPFVTMAIGLFDAGRGGRHRFWYATLIGFIAQCGLGIAFACLVTPRVETMVLAVLGATFCFITAALTMLPILLGAAAYRMKTDLEAGDAMLGVAGGWILLIQTVLLLLSVRDLLLLPGLAVGLLAVAFSVGGIRSRRVWCDRAARGTIDGIRVRRPSSPAELDLPPIYGSPRAVFAVVERQVVGNTAYRSALVGQAIATMRLPRDMRPDGLPAASTPFSA